MTLIWPSEMRLTEHQIAQAEARFPGWSTMVLAVAMTLPVSVLGADINARDDETLFDMRALKSRGVDARVGEMFRYSPRFLPGESTVALTVNGSARGKVKVLFDQDGRLCADQAFQKHAGLIAAPGFTEQAPCFDLKTAWPQTELHLDPSEGRVDLVLPAQAVAVPGTESGNWTHGGFAGLLNYDAQYLDAAGGMSNTQFMQFDTEAGFNLDDWIVRSRQTYSRFNGVNTMRYQAAYAQRSFVESKKVVQLGQINLANSLFSTGRVLGFQVFPEAALQGNQGGAGLVEGFADSQSVVEVRQSGVLIYSTTVPAGPFRLQGLPLLNTGSDLEVTVTDSRAGKRQFVVPASAFLLNGSAVAPGLSFGAGKLDQQGSHESPAIGTIANGWVLNPHMSLSTGLLASTPYTAAGLELISQPFNSTVLGYRTNVAQDKKRGRKGVSGTATLSHNLTERMGVSLNYSQQSEGFSELSDALQADREDYGSRNRNQFGVGGSWSQVKLGNLSLSWARGNTFDGDTSRYISSTWSKTFGRTYVALTASENSGGRNAHPDKRLYLTLNIPFGQGRSLNSYVSDSNRGARVGTRYSDRTSQDRGWSLSGERDLRSRHGSVTASGDLLTPYSKLDGSISQDSDNTTSWFAHAAGSVVAHDRGVTPAAYRVGDTLGIAKVGEESGVRMETPGGPTWTDSRGYAVVPTLSGYRRSTIQLDTRTLARNVDIANAWQEAEAARGSVNYINFDVVRTRRALIDVTSATKKTLPRGTSVFDEKGQFVTVVGEDSRVFIADVNATGVYEVQESGRPLCRFTPGLPEKVEKTVLFETASAVCR